MIKTIIDQERCQGCELCLSVCPKKALTLSEQYNSRGYRYITFDKKKGCTGCTLCALVCPGIAISIYKE